MIKTKTLYAVSWYRGANRAGTTDAHDKPEKAWTEFEFLTRCSPSVPRGTAGSLVEVQVPIRTRMIQKTIWVNEYHYETEVAARNSDCLRRTDVIIASPRTVEVEEEY